MVILLCVIIVIAWNLSQPPQTVRHYNWSHPRSSNETNWTIGWIWATFCQSLPVSEFIASCSLLVHSNYFISILLMLCMEQRTLKIQPPCALHVYLCPNQILTPSDQNLPNVTAVAVRWGLSLWSDPRSRWLPCEYMKITCHMHSIAALSAEDYPSAKYHKLRSLWSN